jgi:hypothetical protein
MKLFCRFYEALWMDLHGGDSKKGRSSESRTEGIK